MNALYSFPVTKYRTWGLQALFCLAALGTAFMGSCILEDSGATRKGTSPILHSHETTRIIDQQVQDAQLIDNEKSIVLGDFTRVCEHCYLQIVQGETMRSSGLNQEVARYGEPVAISNVVDGKIVIAASRVEESGTVKAIRLLLASVVEEKIVDTIELVKTADEPILDEQGLVLDFDTAEQESEWLPSEYLREGRLIKLMLRDDGTLFVSARDKSAKLFVIDFAKKEVKKIVIDPYIKGTIGIPQSAPVLAFDSRHGHAVVGISIDDRQARAFARYFSGLGVNLGGSGILIFAIDSFGNMRIAAFIPISSSFLGQPELAISSDAVFVGATVSRQHKEYAYVAMLRGNSINDGFQISWEQEFQIASSSTRLTSLAIGQNNALFVAGDIGTEQASTGSVIKAGDCFVALMNNTGHVVNHQVFGSASKVDFVVKVLPFAAHDGISLIYLENLPLTHDVKTEPLYSVFRKVLMPEYLSRLNERMVTVET